MSLRDLLKESLDFIGAVKDAVYVQIKAQFQLSELAIVITFKESNLVQDFEVIELIPDLEVLLSDGRVVCFIVKEWRTRTRWDTMASNGQYIKDTDEYRICWSSTPAEAEVLTSNTDIKLLTDSEGKWVGLKVHNASFRVYSE